MKTKLRLPFLVTLLLTLVNLETFAQSTIKGTIIEKSSGETIIGAAILEKGTSNGCVTDYNGKFTTKIRQQLSNHSHNSFYWLYHSGINCQIC